TRKCLNVNFDVPLSSSLIDALLHLIKGTVYENNKSAMLNEHHLIEVVLLLLQSDTRMLLLQSIYPDFLTQVRGLIDSDLSSNWSLERLAKELDMSISTLKRRLQNESLSYRQLLDKARMDKAIELLRNSSQSIAQIALACGYKSQSRFAARFRKYYALNPSDIRSGKTSSAHSH
ncbi:MAG: helix-turn-helix domain-containing protein, partial [Cyanobacteria bacterium J06636_16]